MTLLEIDDGVYVNPEAVAMIKKIDEDSCAVFLWGQGSEHGIVVEESALKVATDVLEELRRSDEDDEDQEPPEREYDEEEPGENEEK